MHRLPWKEPERVAALEQALATRILVIDGAMGTMLQTYHLDESGYRGERFRDGHDARIVGAARHVGHQGGRRHHGHALDPVHLDDVPHAR